MDENRGWQLEAEVEVVQGAEGAVVALERFNNAGITAVAGIIPDSSLTAADRAIHDNNMVVVAYLTGFKENAKPDNVYRVGTNYEHLSEAFVEIMNEDGKNEVMTLFINSPVSRVLNSSIYDLAGAKSDMTVLGSIKFTPGAISDAEGDSIRDSVARLIASAQDTSEIGIFFSGISSSLPVLQAVAELDTGPGSPIRDVTIYGFDSFRPTIETDAGTFEFLQRTGGFHGVPSGGHENEESIRIDSILGRSITVVTYDSYTSLYILGLAVDLAGTAADADAVKAKMHEAAASYTPIAARGLPTDLDANGDVVERDLHISSIQHGQFEFTRKYDPDAFHRINQTIDF
ncbi:MAG: ABC transporter substrate-binding protein [Nitrosopumilaceae archaeon]|nr:ABC transporter substrate-binding protein [Nitrosopumilaceae archaeon]